MSQNPTWLRAPSSTVPFQASLQGSLVTLRAFSSRVLRRVAIHVLSKGAFKGVVFQGLLGCLGFRAFLGLEFTKFSE